MTDRTRLVHYCTCLRWASFGNRDPRGNIIWTCGISGCVEKEKGNG